MKHSILLAGAFLLFANSNQAQLITMSNKCYKMVQQGNQQNNSQQYAEALATFDQVLGKCSAKDAKRAAWPGKAHALNGLQRYSEALEAANAAISSYDKNIYGYFERAAAYMGLSQLAEAQADLNRVLDLTSKNRNTAERATIIAKVAELQYKQNQPNDALNTITQAIAQDQSNGRLYMVRGDMKIKTGDYDGAQDDYDKAMSLGVSSKDVYSSKVNARLSMLSKKYGTTNGSQLKKMASSLEKSSLCDDLKKALSMGVKDINLDMLSLQFCD